MKTILTDGFLTLEGDIPADLEVSVCWYSLWNFSKTCCRANAIANGDSKATQITQPHYNDCQAKAALILQIVKDAGGTYNLTEEIAAGIDSLWQEPLVKEAFDNRAEYQLYDSAE